MTQVVNDRDQGTNGSNKGTQTFLQREVQRAILLKDQCQPVQFNILLQELKEVGGWAQRKFRVNR